MFWVYAAAALLLTLLGLLIAPYLGIYGTQNIESVSEEPASTNSERTGGEK